MHGVASGFFLVRIMRRRWGTCAGIMHESPCTIHTRIRLNNFTSTMLDAHAQICEYGDLEVIHLTSIYVTRQGTFPSLEG